MRPKIASKCKMKSRFDSLGSYTGTVIKDEYDKPVQDADDL